MTSTTIPTPPSRPRSGLLAAGALAAFALVASIGCGNNGGGSDGGGSGGGGGGGGGTPTTTSGRYEVFQASLKAIDPADPTVVIDLDPDAASIEVDAEGIAVALPIVAGTWLSGAVVDARVEEVVYARKDRTLARVSTDPSVGVPAPRQVGADLLPELVCDAVLGPDLADFESTRILVGAADEDCGEPLGYRAIQVSDDAGTNSRPFPGSPLTPLVDPVTGAHTGWLTIDEGSLDRLDADLSVAAANLLRNVQRGEVLGLTRDGFLVLEIAQSVYTFDAATNTLSNELFTFETPCSCNLRFGTDGEFGFASEDDELFRIDLASGDVESIDVAVDAATTPGFFFVPTFVLAGDSRVAWSYLGDPDGNPQTFDDLSVVWRSVAKDGSDAFTIDTLDATGVSTFGFLPYLPNLIGDRLFYNSVRIELVAPSVQVTFSAPVSFPPAPGASTGDPLPGTVVPPPPGGDLESIRALAVQVDLAPGASPDVREDALWIGSSLPGALPVAGLGTASRLHRLTDLPDLMDFENNTDPIGIESVDATNPSAPETPLGTLPEGALFAFVLPGIGPERLAVAAASDGNGEFLPDILYWVDDEANSLIRVTETPDVSELPIPLF